MRRKNEKNKRWDVTADVMFFDFYFVVCSRKWQEAYSASMEA